MAAIPYTKRVLITRVRRHISNSRFVNDSFQISDKELWAYVEQSAAARMTGQIYANAKIEGVLIVPEAYLISYQLTNLKKNYDNGYWYATLPHAPMALPLGYSVTQAYFEGAGRRTNITLVKNKRLAYRNDLPVFDDLLGWVAKDTFWINSTNAASLKDAGKLYVEMPSARSESLDDTLALGEDDIEFIFNDVVKIIAQRFGFPIDVVADDLPTGNKPAA